MAQNILAQALHGPHPEASLRGFLSQASLREIEQIEQTLLDERVAKAHSDHPEDQALVRVCDRWLEIVQEHKLAAQ